MTKKMTEKILISFHRPRYSKVTCEYLCSKLDREEDADVIRNISLLTSGQLKSLKVKEANIVVKKWLQSIIINDEMDDSIISESGTETLGVCCQNHTPRISCLPILSLSHS